MDLEEIPALNNSSTDIPNMTIQDMLTIQFADSPSRDSTVELPAVLVASVGDTAPDCAGSEQATDKSNHDIVDPGTSTDTKLDVNRTTTLVKCRRVTPSEVEFETSGVTQIKEKHPKTAEDNRKVIIKPGRSRKQKWAKASRTTPTSEPVELELFHPGTELFDDDRKLIPIKVTEKKHKDKSRPPSLPALPKLRQAVCVLVEFHDGKHIDPLYVVNQLKDAKGWDLSAETQLIEKLLREASKARNDARCTADMARHSIILPPSSALPARFPASPLPKKSAPRTNSTNSRDRGSKKQHSSPARSRSPSRRAADLDKPCSDTKLKTVSHE